MSSSDSISMAVDDAPLSQSITNNQGALSQLSAPVCPKTPQHKSPAYPAVSAILLCK